MAASAALKPALDWEAIERSRLHLKAVREMSQ